VEERSSLRGRFGGRGQIEVLVKRLRALDDFAISSDLFPRISVPAPKVLQRVEIAIHIENGDRLRFNAA